MQVTRRECPLCDWNYDDAGPVLDLDQPVMARPFKVTGDFDADTRSFVNAVAMAHLDKIEAILAGHMVEHLDDPRLAKRLEGSGMSVDEFRELVLGASVPEKQVVGLDR